MSDLSAGARSMLESHSDYDESLLRFNDMDKDGVYSIYDSCANVFGTPFIMDNDNSAIRAFSDYCHIPDTSVFKHPDDYSLYCLGYFCKSTGELKSCSTPLMLMKATSIVYSLKQQSVNSSGETSEISPDEFSTPAEQVNENSVQDDLTELCIGGDN